MRVGTVLEVPPPLSKVAFAFRYQTITFPLRHERGDDKADCR